MAAATDPRDVDPHKSAAPANFLFAALDDEAYRRFASLALTPETSVARPSDRHVYTSLSIMATTSLTTPGEAPPAEGGFFLNLSNHPVGTWSPEQRDAARALGLGEPADLEGGLPLVDPGADTEQVIALADDVVRQAVVQGVRGAHVAGEFTLTLALVRALQGQGVPCYAATTRREVEERLGPGGETQKVSQFRFFRWRAYP